VTLAANLRTQSYQYGYQVAEGRWVWTTQVDVTLASPVYRITNIVSPYGILRDTIPIPGEVITAMSDSIAEIQQQFPPTILLGPPTSLTFTVDEGRGFSPSQNVVLTNTGVYGSLLGTTLVASASYILVDPETVGNLSFNESGAFDVSVDSTDLLAASSPYVGSVTVQDVHATNSPQLLPVNIIVRPKAVIDLSVPSLSFSVVKPLTGVFPPIPSQDFTIENIGPSGSVLDYQVQRVGTASHTWLTSFSPVSGTLGSAETDIVTVNVAPDSNLTAGVYTETLRVSGYSSNSYVDLEVTLTIT